MEWTRRAAMQALASAGIGASLFAGGTAVARPSGRQTGVSSLLKPPRLRVGDRVGLIAPARAAFETQPVEILLEALEALGLRPIEGPNYYRRRGYFAGTDEERASDINRFFADPEVKALFGTGGWGSARVLPLLDYDVIRANPKPVVGFSDVTALLLGLHAKTGLVTFHGPIARRSFSADWQRRLLFDADTPTFENPAKIAEGEIVQTRDRIQTLRPGKARGRLLGGNLTVLSAIVGSDYLPDWDGCILFLEDVREEVYRVDRMLTQLRLAGILDRIAGFVFGYCTDCRSGTSYGSLTLEEVLQDHIGPLGVPAWRGALVGHIERQFTLPLGVEAEIDAQAGAIRLLEPAVS